MTIKYLLEPNPIWYFATQSGLPLGAGYLAVYSSLNHNIQKLVYQNDDPNNLIPWPTEPIPNTSLYGVLIDLNGTQGPFYFVDDTENPDDRYFLRAYDKVGVLIWSQDNYPFQNTQIEPEDTLGLNNLVINNVFWRNNGTSSTPIGTTYFPLAPGVHDGITFTPSLVSPDICLVKNNTTASDTVSFPTFGVGSNDLLPDVTPPNYLNYTCTNTPSGETFKFIQIPITQDVNYLCNQTVTVSCWARCNSGNNQLSFTVRQFFGDGSTASAPVNNLIGTATLTSAWQKFTFTSAAPLSDISGKTLGQCGNSGVFLNINLPISVATNIDLVKPCLFIGTTVPTIEYQTQSEITAITDSPRTSDVRSSFGYTSPFSVPGGWILVTGNASDIDVQIGSPSSGADYADIETFPLYNLFWNRSDVYCPLYTSTGVPTTKGVSAIADFSANKQLQLPPMGGRTFSGAVPTGYNYSKTITNVNTGTNVLTINDTSPFYTGQQVEFGVWPGGVLPSHISPTPAIYYLVVLSSTTFGLATTYANAVTLNNNLMVGNAGTLPFYVTGIIPMHPECSYVGQDSTPPTLETMYAHTHGPGNLNDNASYVATVTTGANINVYTPIVSTPSPIVMNAGVTSSTGGGLPFPVTQPTIYGNYLIKL